MKTGKVILLMIAMMIFLSGGMIFGQETDEPVAAIEETGVEVEHITIKGSPYPIYPGARKVKASMVSASFHTAENIETVKTWYDQRMETEGWRILNEWEQQKRTFKKNYLKGESPKRKPHLAEKMVKVKVYPHWQDGGTQIVILPLAVHAKIH